MDEPIKQLVTVAIAVIAGLALFALLKGDNGIVASVSSSIKTFITNITSQVN